MEIRCYNALTKEYYTKEIDDSEIVEEVIEEEITQEEINFDVMYRLTCLELGITE